MAASARSLAWAADNPCCRSARDTIAPTRNTGLKASDGLWKMAAILAPRMARIRAPDSPVSSWPSSRTEPVTAAPAVSASPSTARIVIDLPEPLSPARPTISPRSTVSSGTDATGCPPKLTRRSRISSLTWFTWFTWFTGRTPCADQARRAARRRAG